MGENNIALVEIGREEVEGVEDSKSGNAGNNNPISKIIITKYSNLTGSADLQMHPARPFFHRRNHICRCPELEF